MEKPELLLPAGNEECLRAAVNNGADAVYLGMSRFNAREYAGNFDEKSIFSAVKYCHDRKVKVYVALNTLVKNNELKEYFSLMNAAYSSGADAVIIQDICLIPAIKNNFPGLGIHVSTQATTTNSYSVPEGADRVILARELSFEEIKDITGKLSGRCRTEIFVHGALCFCYSGQCLFSSIIGGRSGNRGRCAQPCRRLYNNKYMLSTMDLCLLNRLPMLIEAGVSAFKIEGRLRSPLYVATAARIYRKYIDMHFSRGNGKRSKVEEKDIDDLKIAFNREFTEGFAFSDNIVDSRKPMNRGLYIGTMRKGMLKLEKGLKSGDGIGIWIDDNVIGQKIGNIIKEGTTTEEAFPGDMISIDVRESIKNLDSAPIYKTSSVDMKVDLGDEIAYAEPKIKKKTIVLPQPIDKQNKDRPKIFAKAYSMKSALALDKSKADIIYYDVMRDDCSDLKGKLKNSRFFVFTPRILSDKQAEDVARRIAKIKPDGVLVANRGLLKLIDAARMKVHLDHSLNCFNDIDLDFYGNLVPVISPELNLKEAAVMRNKNFIALCHGDIVLMTTKQSISAPEIIDEEGRHFRVRERDGVWEILNSNQLGLFNKTKDYLKNGIKYFMIDTSKDADKFVRIYRKIIDGEAFDDRKIRKGYTTGHFERGVE